MRLLGWAVRPTRYRRTKDGEQSEYWTASKRVNGKYESVYLGAASADTDLALRRALAKLLRERLEAKGMSDIIERDREPISGEKDREPISGEKDGAPNE